MYFKTFVEAFGVALRASAKTLLIMKLTVVVILVTCVQVTAKSYSQNLTLSFRNAPLDQVFNAIKKQTGFSFLWDEKVLENARPVSIRVRNASLEHVMNICVKDQPLMFTIINNMVVIKQKNAPPEVIETPSPPPPIIVSGRITGTNGEALAGVTITLKGTQTVAATDDNGIFTIAVPDKRAVLVITYVGHQTQEITVGDRTNIAVQLVQGNAKMNEVVVVAYGTQRRGEVTASVASIKGDEITAQPVSNISASLGGRVTGVIFSQGFGEPGNDAANILIRGASTVGNTQPLVVVDGVPRNYNQLDPNSIESISILKDAAAVAPYGMAGANGVILITTKRGKSGAPTLSYNGYVGWQNLTTIFDMVNAYEYATLFNAGNANQGQPPRFSEEEIQKYRDHTDPDQYPDQDSFDELITPNTLMTSHNLSLSGGGERVRYYTSLGYLSQKGIWGPTNFKRYNVTANIESDATKTTKVSLSLNGRVEDRRTPGVLQEVIWGALWRRPPIYPLTFTNGLPGSAYGTSAWGNIYGSGYRQSLGFSLLNQFAIEQQLPFIKGLSVKGVISYDFNPFNPTNPNPGAGIMSLQKIWLTPIVFYSYDPVTKTYPRAGSDGPAKPSYAQFYNQSQALTYQGYLNYNRKFGDHAVTGLVVLESRVAKTNVFGARRVNYNVNVPELDNGSSNAADISNSGYSTEARQKSALYRVTYSYASKYLLELSGRYDGHYAFAPDYRFGFFPAFSAGWRLSEETFFRNAVPWINELKIRGSFGESGGLPYLNGQLASFQYLSSFTLYGNGSVLGDGATQGAFENAQPNMNITWERAKKTNVGFDATLWNGLLNIEADYFFEKRTGMLFPPTVTVPLEYGIGLSQENAGAMNNRGFEISASSSKRISNDLYVGLSANFTYAKNKLVQVFETDATFNNPNRRVTGRPLGTQFGYQAIGYFLPDDFNPDGSLKEGIATQPWGTVFPGDIRYADLSGPDGKPDGELTPDDITVIGKPSTPQLIYGFSPSVRFKGFDFNLLFQGAGSRGLYISMYPFDNAASALKSALDYWTPENLDARYPRITTGVTQNSVQRSSHWMNNGSYLRLKTGELGYTIPHTVMQRIKIQSARVYVACQNLLTWSRIEDFDPEVLGASFGLGTPTVRADVSYPQTKVVSVGLNVTF